MLVLTSHKVSSSDLDLFSSANISSSSQNLDLGDDVMVMDVCCGAGTIGICAAAAGGAKRVSVPRET